MDAFNFTEEAPMLPPARWGFSDMNAKVRSVLLSILMIVFYVAMSVSLPVYAGTMNQIGGDTFCVLFVACLWYPIIFFLILLGLKYLYNRDLQLRATVSHKVLLLVGFLLALNGIFVVFSSPPDRTPPYLQGILSQMLIPYTIIAKYILLRKGISIARFLCTCTVVVGVFITMEPQIWGLGDESTVSSSESTTGRILWPLAFGLGFLPSAMISVIAEKFLKVGEGDSLNFLAWAQLYQIMTILLLFWVDFLPGFGMAKSFSQFGDHISNGLRCTFSSTSDCNGLAGKTWLLIVGYVFGNLTYMLLIQYTEGAVYAVIVQTMVGPLSTLFWTVFRFDVEQNHFWWGPSFDTTTIYILAGLVLVVPGVVLYNYFSNKEADSSVPHEIK